MSQINDYINVLKQYSVNNEVLSLEKKLKMTVDRGEKLVLAQKLFELKKGQDSVKKER